MFVHLGEPRSGLRESLEQQSDKPLQYERWRMDELQARRIAPSPRCAANWKILVENYNECLHCPTVHPELVAVAPTFRKGLVFEEGRDDWGVSIAGGGSRLHGHRDDERSRVMPGLDEQHGELDVRRDDLPEHVRRPHRHGRDRDPAAAARRASTRRW